jgi:hypothetical protein
MSDTTANVSASSASMTLSILRFRGRGEGAAEGVSPSAVLFDPALIELGRLLLRGFSDGIF